MRIYVLTLHNFFLNELQKKEPTIYENENKIENVEKNHQEKKLEQSSTGKWPQSVPAGIECINIGKQTCLTSFLYKRTKPCFH